jgi:outer membrane murein-binding lipoprotein Lpp
MTKKMLMVSAVALGGLLFSGCSATANYYTQTKKLSAQKPIVDIKVDQDSTSLGWINAGNVTRTNYLYAFGTAAQTTVNNGYKYFTIIKPEELVKQYKDRNVHNLQGAYDACDSGENSFKVGTSLAPADIHNNHCDHIIYERRQATLSGQVIHRAIGFTIEMHNDPRPNSYATFDAQEVLKSDLLKDLNKEYFKENVR